MWISLRYSVPPDVRSRCLGCSANAGKAALSVRDSMLIGLISDNDGRPSERGGALSEATDKLSQAHAAAF